MEEKIKNLENARKQLKSDFVGIDNLIDQLITCISPWYLTPEILEKPHVVSLWGLTGTGKTSVVRSLLAHLGLTRKTLFYDCGENHNGESCDSLSRKLENFFESEDEDLYDTDPYQTTIQKCERSSVFVFDEFQHTRTIDKYGNDKDTPGLRGIWNLMDHGIIDIVSRSWGFSELLNYIEQLESIYSVYPDTEVSENEFPTSMTEIIRKKYSYSLYSTFSDLNGLDRKTAEKFPVISGAKLNTIQRRMNAVRSGYGYELVEQIEDATSFSQIIEILAKVKPYLQSAKMINCSKSLIIVIGNIDSAYPMASSSSPDIDADIFHNMTKAVTIVDIKKALGTMYHPEQVGRLGNSVILYPSLRKKNFKTIISKELEKKETSFLGVTGIKVTHSMNFEDYIYDEGVYPVQGVRPLMTTLNNIFGAHLSDLIVKCRGVKSPTAIVSADSNPDSTVKVSYHITGNDGEFSECLEFIDTPCLTKLRSTQNKSKLPIYSVHEAAHALVYYSRTGKTPDSVVALTAEGSGITCEDSSSASSELVKTGEDMKTEIMVCLAGYYGERLFWEPDQCSLGASSDLKKAWEVYSTAVYECGYLYPVVLTGQFSGASVQPKGVNHELSLNIPTPVEKKDSTEKMIFTNYQILADYTQSLVEELKDEIKNLAKILIEKRSITKQEFQEFVEGTDIKVSEEMNYYDIFKD